MEHLPDLTGLAALQSQNLWKRLNQVDRLRADNIGDYISLPQMGVFGDQSAGKSSVLHALTAIPWPRRDGICTKFATEIVLRHDISMQRVTATILPHQGRTEAEKTTLRRFNHVVPDFSHLPNIIDEAARLMGIRGYGDTEHGTAFAKDVLRIEVIGRTGLHLTVVDLPGLISVSNEEQTEEDVTLVSELVDSYLASSRTIILAVIQAPNDIATQGIIQRARRYDPRGERTVGIITKADLINKGTEQRITSLVKNRDSIKLRLGFFVLKNPSPQQLEGGITQSERDQQELQFFSTQTWQEQNLPGERVGADALRHTLQGLLEKHIEKELPKVIEEVQGLLEQTETSLANLGEERVSIIDQRLHLTRLAMAYHNIVNGALSGNYLEHESTDFDDTEDKNNLMHLRAEVHRLNNNFAKHMREKGEKRKLDSRSSADSSEEEEDQLSSELPKDGQIEVTHKQLLAWVKKIYVRTRGKELPGAYNHILQTALFHEQSCRWSMIASKHIDELYHLSEKFVKRTLNCVVREERSKIALMNLILARLAEARTDAQAEFNRLLEDEMLHPITYNHYYTDNIQNARHDSVIGVVAKAIKSSIAEDWHGKFYANSNGSNYEKLLSSIQGRILVDMDKQACSDALAGLNAYYKVAMKTFVDNVCRQVIERHLLKSLPETFSPSTVAAFSDDVISELAAETSEQLSTRTSLKVLASKLRESLRELRS